MLIESVIEEKAGKGELLGWFKAGENLFPCPLGTPVACDVDLYSAGGSLSVRRGRVMFDYRRGGVVHSYAMLNPALPLQYRCFRHLVMCSTFKEAKAGIIKYKVLEPESRKGLYQAEAAGWRWEHHRMQEFVCGRFKKVGKLSESDQAVPLDELAARLVEDGRFQNVSELCVLEELSSIDNELFADYRFSCKVVGAATRQQLLAPGYTPPVGGPDELRELLGKVDFRRAYALVTVGCRLKVEPDRSCPPSANKLQ